MLQSVSFSLPEMGSISAGKAADCDRMAADDASVSGTSNRTTVPQASSALLLGTSEIQKELGIDAEQKQKMDRLRGELEGQSKATHSIAGDFRDGQGRPNEEFDLFLANV